MKPSCILIVFVAACGAEFEGLGGDLDGGAEGEAGEAEAAVEEASVEGDAVALVDAGSVDVDVEAGVETAVEGSTEAAVSDVGAEASSCSCIHEAFVGSGDSCGLGPSCAEVGKNPCYRCVCAAPDRPACELVAGRQDQESWWCCL